MFAREAIVQQIFRQETLLNTVWVALTRRVAEANAPGSSLDEPAFGYSRVQVPFGTDHWGLTGYSEVYNLNPVDFPTPTGPWGLIQGYALVTHSNGGQTIATGPLVNPQRVNFGFNPIIAASGIVFGLSD